MNFLFLLGNTSKNTSEISKFTRENIKGTSDIKSECRPLFLLIFSEAKSCLNWLIINSNKFIINFHKLSKRVINKLMIKINIRL